MKLKLSLILFLFSAISAWSQISINPMLLFIDKNSRTGSFDVSNPTKEVREFTLEFQFGYPDYDENGKQEMKYNDSLLEKEYSLIPYLKYFPKRLVIPPGESQTVRFIVSGLPEASDRTYWTRVVGASEPVVKQIDTTTKDLEPGKIRPVIVLKSVVNGLVAYQKGNVTSSVDFNFIKIYKDSANTHILFDFQKTGNSPFLGVASYKIFDSNDNVLIENSTNLAIYKNAVIDFQHKSSELGTGKIKIELIVNNERRNVPSDFHIPFEPVTKTFSVDL